MMDEFKTYYKNGQLQYHYFETDGRLDGEYLSYFSNGQLYLKCHYTNCKRHGPYMSYSKNGKLQRQRYYYMDTIIGPDAVVDIEHPTPEELMMLELKYGGMA